MNADGRPRHILLGAAAALALTFAGSASAAISKGSISSPKEAGGGADATVAHAMERARAGDCKSVLALLDPVVASGVGKGSASRFSAQLLRMPCLAGEGRDGEIP